MRTVSLHAIALVFVLATLAGAPAVVLTQEPITAGQDTAGPRPDSLADTTSAPAPEATAPPVSDQRAGTDSEAARELAAIFARISGLRGISVRVEAGVASLTGTVPSLEDRDRAVELARSFQGVVFVDNEIQIATSLRTRLAPAWERIRERLFDFLAYLPLMAVAVLLVALFWVLSRWVDRSDRFYRRISPNSFVQNFARQAARALTLLVGVLLALEILDATTLVGAVLGTAGVFGIAVGFAFRDVVENYLAGVLLSLRQPFAPNDHIVVEGHEGKVVRLSPRESVLMTPDGNHLRIPNALVFKSVVLNYTRNPRRRFTFRVSVGTGVDLAAALATGVDVLARTPGVLEDPAPAGRIEELGDSSVTLVFLGWVNQQDADFSKVRSLSIRRVKNGLEEAGVEMPAPEYGVRILAGAVPAPVDKPAGVAAPELPSRPPSTAAGREAASHDVSPDLSIDEQIEEDREAYSEEDFLEPTDRGS